MCVRVLARVCLRACVCLWRQAAEPMETKVRVVGGGGRAGKGMFITMGGFTEQDGRFSHELDNDTEA